MKTYSVYTDGSSFDEKKRGGWGCIVYPEFLGKKYDKLEFNGHINGDVTSNRMELLAVINAIQHLPKNSHIKIFTDSKYTLFGSTIGIHIWPKNNWLSRKNRPIRNRSLWETLHSLIKKYDRVEVNWVKGHGESHDNKRADILARLGSYNKIICPRSQFKLFDVYISCEADKDNIGDYSWKFRVKGNDFLADLSGVDYDSDPFTIYRKISKHIFYILDDKDFEFINLYSTNKVFKKIFEKKTTQCNFMHLYDQKIHPNIFDYYKESFL
jgi:ribonuclease HI